MASLLLQPGGNEPLAILGQARKIQVVAFGRNGEPARGHIVITNDEQWAFGTSPWPHVLHHYRWPIERPNEYSSFKVYWASTNGYRKLSPGPSKPHYQSAGQLIAALSPYTILIGTEIGFRGTGVPRWEIAAVNPISPAKVRHVASGGDSKAKPSFVSAVFDSASGWLNTNHGRFRVENKKGKPWAPRYRVERREGPTFFEVDAKTGAALQVGNKDSSGSFRYWRNALFRGSDDGSGMDFWDRPNKRWVRLGFTVVGESTDRTKLVVANLNASPAKPAPTFIVRLKQELR